MGLLSSYTKEKPTQDGWKLTKVELRNITWVSYATWSNFTTKDFKAIRSYRAEDQEVNLDQSQECIE